MIGEYGLSMARNMRNETFGHLRKVSSRNSLRSPRRLIRDGTLRLHKIFHTVDLRETETRTKNGKCCLGLVTECTG